MAHSAGACTAHGVGSAQSMPARSGLSFDAAPESKPDDNHAANARVRVGRAQVLFGELAGRL